MKTSHCFQLILKLYAFSSVDGKHLMHFQSGISIFKFVLPGVDRGLLKTHHVDTVTCRLRLLIDAVMKM